MRSLTVLVQSVFNQNALFSLILEGTPSPGIGEIQNKPNISFKILFVDQFSSYIGFYSATQFAEIFTSGS